jgi:hypothetical protein
VQACSSCIRKNSTGMWLADVMQFVILAFGPLGQRARSAARGEAASVSGQAVPGVPPGVCVPACSCVLRSVSPVQADCVCTDCTRCAARVAHARCPPGRVCVIASSPPLPPGVGCCGVHGGSPQEEG